MESAIDSRLKAADVGESLREWVTRRDVRGMAYSPTNERIRDLWNALGGAPLTQTEWWSAYKTGVDARDRFVHSGEAIGTQDAERFIDAAEAAMQPISRAP